MGIARQSPPSSELKIFADRLQKAIEFKKIDIAVLAESLEYKPDVIHRMLKGMREPSMRKLILLANSLGCSVDYLLGLTPEAKRATVVVTADTNAIELQPSERGPTSGQISGNVEQIVALLPKLLEFDVELIRFIIDFLIKKRKERLARLIGAVTAKSSEEIDSKSKEVRAESDINFAEEDFFTMEDDDLEEDDFGEDDDLEDEDEDEDDFDDD
jgi:transcriptional regulator with XRE-family HTH domain